MASKYPRYYYQLTIDKLPDVVDLFEGCGFSQERWYELGLTLGLHKNTLDAIKRENGTMHHDCLTECLSKWLSRADNFDSKGETTFDLSLPNALKSMNENAAADKLKEGLHQLLMGPVMVGSAPDRLPDTPPEGLDPMPVTPEVISIAEKMKKNAEKKLKTSFTTYTPLYYIKKGEIDYCIRIFEKMNS
ncbi:PREDICTED: uncharacterized protein LOC109589807 isoform X2 [Amphimedon queenslandica]|uniref:Death domain-containing protein n=1 Tax=Amphimedon queenslandica TaxID=400682 RepID=A0AAN0JWU9_AMPQE|nr:PREDICTED: uncharacterized protein LOC109589807 isoform X2 [Amphimedon queenslandica]|eukprot:XP_019861376.1 PREDICTED: uncharacterized protein LOC109589807 isoform X2 [Amphimedon queenslandica]